MPFRGAHSLTARVIYERSSQTIAGTCCFGERRRKSWSTLEVSYTHASFRYLPAAINACHTGMMRLKPRLYASFRRDRCDFETSGICTMRRPLHYCSAAKKWSENNAFTLLNSLARKKSIQNARTQSTFESFSKLEVGYVTISASASQYRHSARASYAESISFIEEFFLELPREFLSSWRNIIIITRQDAALEEQHTAWRLS